MERLFRTGSINATPGVLAALRPLAMAAEATTALTMWDMLERHVSGDWGDVDAEDAEANTAAVRTGGRVLSAYRLPGGARVWIITEADRSVTTLLLRKEY